jgi:hypothetical protein
MNVPGGCNVGGLLGNGNDNDDIVVADVDVDVPIAEQVENGKVYTLHVFGGLGHIVIPGVFGNSGGWEMMFDRLLHCGVWLLLMLNFGVWYL